MTTHHPLLPPAKTTNQLPNTNIIPASSLFTAPRLLSILAAFSYAFRPPSSSLPLGFPSPLLLRMLAFSSSSAAHSHPSSFLFPPPQTSSLSTLLPFFLPMFVFLAFILLSGRGPRKQVLTLSNNFYETVFKTWGRSRFPLAVPTFP